VHKSPTNKPTTTIALNVIGITQYQYQAGNSCAEEETLILLLDEFSLLTLGPPLTITIDYKFTTSSFFQLLY